ncbi:antitermination protein NusG [Niastella yeongjuensis]|uniref:Antitermination protein NusG n=1 Tax=Niastella yeongjuensis TaxID=354355 RepID=A0A1V9FCD2_9BACT|nr:UpxY family transcription antiterminator [Niastella yeongjuensis]OQP56029.1 antitermination protein NusG [Niastella yeongjuensis]SEP24742.1 Transcription antitermination factor NusG [Niastella yeongjuensis]
MEANKKWYAVYTRPRWEKKVADLLVKKHIETYCPLNKIVRQWADRKKLVLEPLFTSYVFVHTMPQEQLAIRQTDGILNFVYWLGQPAVIRDEEIEAVKQFLDEYHNVQLEKIHVNMHDRVRIASGPLMAREGDVIEVRSKTVKVQLPSLGYALTAEVEKANVEVIPMATSYANNFYNALFK